MGSAWRRRRKLAWATALAASLAVHAGLLVFLVGDHGPLRTQAAFTPIEIELTRIERRPPAAPPPPKSNTRQPPRSAPISPPIRSEPSPVPEPAPFAAARPAPAPPTPGPPSELPRLSLDNDPCSPARRSALTALQRERCDHRVRGYTDFKTDRPTQFEQQARQGYIKQDTPYLPRKPEHGCKPYAAPIPATGGGDEVMAGIACGWKF